MKAICSPSVKTRFVPKLSGRPNANNLYHSMNDSIIIIGIITIRLGYYYCCSSYYYMYVCVYIYIYIYILPLLAVREGEGTALANPPTKGDERACKDTVDNIYIYIYMYMCVYIYTYI